MSDRAFPTPTILTPNGEVEHWGEPGMSLRDWFAGQAMVGLLRTKDALHLLNAEPEYPFHVNFADSCYLIADAMLAARAPAPGEAK